MQDHTRFGYVLSGLFACHGENGVLDRLKLIRFGFTWIQASYTHLMGSLLSDQPHKKISTRQSEIRVLEFGIRKARKGAGLVTTVWY